MHYASFEEMRPVSCWSHSPYLHLEVVIAEPPSVCSGEPIPLYPVSLYPVPLSSVGVVAPPDVICFQRCIAKDNGLDCNTFNRHSNSQANCGRNNKHDDNTRLQLVQKHLPKWLFVLKLPLV